MKKMTELPFIRKIAENEKYLKLALAAGVLIIAAIFLSDLAGSFVGDSETSIPQTTDEYASELEAKLTTVLSEISGTGKLTVMLTMESSGENVMSERGNSVTEIVKPKVRGVLVICEGGGNPVVREKVSLAVSRLLDIGASDVCVTN